MNYNTEEWLSIRVNADKLIYCKTRTRIISVEVGRSPLFPMKVFFEEGGCLTSERNSRGIQPIAEKILKTETKLRSKSSSCGEKLSNEFSSVLFQPTMQTFFNPLLSDISQNSRPDNGGSTISRDESKTGRRMSYSAHL